MKRWVIVLVFITLGAASANAQLVRDLHTVFTPGYFERSRSDSSSFKPWKRIATQKTGYSFEVGTSYSSFGGGMGLSTSYISPSMVYMPTQNLMLEVGGRFSYNNLNSTHLETPRPNGQIGQTNAGNPSEAYVRAHYMVSDRLSIQGTGAFGQNQVFFSPFSQSFGTTDYQHLSFGMDYKVSEKVSIGASFGFTNGPAWGTPFTRYGWSPFLP